MVDWYMKGQSDYLSSDFHMGFWFDVNGFPEANYDSIVMPDDVATGDPFMAVAAETKPTWNPGSQVIEIGLWDHNRIKIDTGGIWGWHNASGVWISLYGGIGGGSGATQLSELLDVENVDYTDGYVLRGNNSKYVSAELAHGDLSDAPTSAHHVKTIASELSHNSLANINAGDSYEHITQTQKTALHSIYTLEQHNNDYHNPDFCVDDDGRLSDSRTPTQHAMDSATYHSRTDIATLDASTSFHGFLKKLDNDDTHYMDGQGNWTVPTGTGGDTKEVSLQYVEDTGLVLSSTIVITSADEDLTFTLGRTQIDARLTNYMVLSHRGMTTTANYAIRQNSAGETRVNSATGQNLSFCINGGIEAYLTSTQFNYQTLNIITTLGDTLHQFGRAQIGHNSYSDHMAIEHRSMTAAGQYALLQSSIGNTMLNAANTRTISFRVNNTEKMSMSATALTLSSGQVISSADEDGLTFTFGRFGTAGVSDYMYLGHRDNIGTGDFCLRNSAGGGTILNATTGNSIGFTIQSATKMTMTTSSFTTTIPIAMGSNKITGLAAGDTNGDAVRYEQISGIGEDTDAIHVDVADEIHLITEESSPASTDVLVVESAGNSWAKRRVQITNLPGGADPDAIHDDVSDEIHQITLKAAPVGDDEIVIEDSAASWAKKRVTITSLPYDVGVDGGRADSVYLPGQSFDGGSA